MWKNFETKKYRGMVNASDGQIVAYENSPRLSRRKITANVKEKTNPFPYTDLDFVLLKAKEVMGL